MKSLNIKSFAFSTLLLGLAQTSAMGFSMGATDFSGTQEVEKVLLLDIDVSGSVDNDTEYDLIMDGYANAFRNNFIQDAILYWDENGTKPKKGIVIGVEFWSTQQQMLTYKTDHSDYAFNTTDGYTNGNKWFLLDSETDINNFATLLDNAPRPPKTVNNSDVIGGGTNLAGALDRSEAELNALLNPSGDVTYSGSTSGSTVTATNTQGTIETVLQETIVDVSSDGYHDRQTLDGNSGSCDDRKDTNGNGVGNPNGNDPNSSVTQNDLGTGYILDCQQVLTDAIVDLVIDANAPADRINALPILGEAERYRDILDIYYRDGLNVTGGQIGPVITGNNAFAETANEFSDFERAILSKLAREVPFEFSPALGLILGGGIFGSLHWFKKLKK